MKNSLVAALCLLVTGTVVSAQSLVEVANKEKERRKKVESRETHSYNERDLKSNGFRTASASSSSSSTTSASTATSSDGTASTNAAAPEDPTGTQAYWHDKVSALDKKIQDLQSRLASPEMTANTRGAAERQKVEKDLAQAKADRDALADEARRKGVPPGWLR